MGHNPATQGKKIAESKRVLETRSGEDIIKAIRGNLAAHLSITPGDIAFLLKQYDAAQAEIVILQAQVATLITKTVATAFGLEPGGES